MKRETKQHKLKKFKISSDPTTNAYTKQNWKIQITMNEIEEIIKNLPTKKFRARYFQCRILLDFEQRAITDLVLGLSHFTVPGTSFMLALNPNKGKGYFHNICATVSPMDIC